MNAWVLALLPAVIGVDYGWERKEDGSIVYIIQVEPEAVESMKTGAELVGALPPQLRNITNYKIRLGRDVLPNHNQLPPEISNRTAIPPPSPFSAATGTQPLSNTQPLGGTQPATSNYQTQPNYGTKPNYGTQPNYVGAPATSPLAGSAGGTPTSTSGFAMAGSNTPGYNQPGAAPAVGNGAFGSGGFVNNGGMNYNNTQPGYGQGNPNAPNYPQPAAAAGNGGYVYNAATGTWGPAATATLPTGATSPTNWTAANTPTYGVAGQQQPGYGAPPALGPASGQPANWASNPNANYYGPTNAGQTGPALAGHPDYQNVNRPGLDATQPQQGGFVVNTTGANSAGANAAAVPTQNRQGEPASQHANGAAATTPPAEPEKSLGLMWVLVGLFASLAFNLWCGWNLYNIRERYRSLLSERTPAY